MLLVDQVLLVAMMEMEVLMEDQHMVMYTEHHCLLPLLEHRHAGSRSTLPRNLMAEGGQGHQNG